MRATLSGRLCHPNNTEWPPYRTRSPPVGEWLPLCSAPALGYLGWQDTVRGLLLAEASHGSLQRYLEENHDTISTPIRRKWCRQVVESIAYIHGRGVIHSDLRPDNFLVHAITPKSLDLWLCDFGGSTCEKLGLDGKHLPDPGFFNPNSEWVSTTATDIFSVGSILYAILTGHWPYRAPGPF
ncbi:hypothetical protein NPX13_g2494 [Xylaria arbuscula]|uniref:EKC/KEOPS complex subunit BUD32 n=1 Tax=Xylaria arbuscula TaxID=114810 RepID=A0A9W8NJN3_9PEZI|nr:hypothetical protein NPX13_g2494 [Xylaria arbuscula]